LWIMHLRRDLRLRNIDHGLTKFVVLQSPHTTYRCKVDLTLHKLHNH
jgi:hypothetical protein